MDGTDAERLARLRADGTLTEAEYQAAMAAHSASAAGGDRGAWDPQAQWGQQATAPGQPDGWSPQPQWGQQPPTGQQWGPQGQPTGQPWASQPQWGQQPPPGQQPWGPQPAQQSWAQSSAPLYRGPQAIGTTDDSRVDPYFQQRFHRFDAQGRVATWNWPAFFFGALWYLVKGLWAKALIVFAVAVVSGGILAIPAWIYAGLFANHDLYLLHRHGKQV